MEDRKFVKVNVELFKELDVKEITRQIIELEDMIHWAEQPVPEFKVVPGLPYSKKKKPLLNKLVFQWLP